MTQHEILTERHDDIQVAVGLGVEEIYDMKSYKPGSLLVKMLSRN